MSDPRNRTGVGIDIQVPMRVFEAWEGGFRDCFHRVNSITAARHATPRKIPSSTVWMLA
jgi:hypothetical protein